MSCQIRKLDNIEKLVNRRHTAQNFISTFRVGSKVDLFENGLNTLKNAIRKWKNMHKFLRANVVCLDAQKDEFAYSIDENSTANVDLTNVHFVRFKSDNKERIDELIEQFEVLLFEKCHTVDLIEFERHPDDLLWRLIFIEYPSSDKEFPFSYEILTQYHHMISDGSCCYINFVQLLNAIDSEFGNRTYEEIEKLRDRDVYAGSEKYFQEKEPKFAPYLGLPKLPRPSFVDPNRAKSTSYKEPELISDLKKIEIVNVESNTPFVSVEELLEISKSSNVRYRRFVIERDVTKKLMEKCKREQVKLTTCINLVECLALRKMYERYGEKSLDNIVSYIAVNLRPFLGVDADNMGYCIGRFLTLLKAEDGLNEETFWEKARPISDEFTDRVVNSDDKFSIKLQALEDPKTELSTQVNISNMGVLDLKLINGSKFRIDRRFVCPSIRSDAIGYYFFNHMSTLDNRLCWSFSFNSYFIDRDFIDGFISFTKEILFKLI
jgi:hypothetical protein